MFDLTARAAAGLAPDRTDADEPVGCRVGSIGTGTEVLQRYPLLERVADSYPGQPAEDYRLPGYRGTIGLIRPISHRFCHVCNRIRVTADGKVKGCLGQDDEYDLLPWLDQPDDALLAQALAAAIRAKPPRHQFEAHQVPSRSMDRTGG
ncbi:MAG: hypothetical protein LRY48_01885 [Bacteroides graminisolvens]|nr:hypothetical protein [Bacteroides graminisolvens]